MSELVKIELHGSAALVTLNVPERRNVLSHALVGAITKAFDELEANPVVQSVVLTGAGKAFCAGAEMSVLRGAADGDFDAVRPVYNGFLRVLRSPLPTIAAVNGPAVGAGFNLVLACDVRLAGKKAVFDTRFTQLRLHPGGGHTWLLTRAVGQQNAMLATLYGEVWDAEKAKNAGLVASVHEDDKLVEDALALARRLDPQEPVFTRRIVDTIRKVTLMPTHDEGLAHETEAQEWSSTRPAFREGVTAMEAKISSAKK